MSDAPAHDQQLPPTQGLLQADERAPLSRRQLLFLGIIVLLALAFTGSFLWLITRCVFPPAMGVAFFGAVAVATLVYAFLGGAAGYVTTPGIRLGGSAAVFAAVIFIVNGPLERQMAERIRSCERPPYLRVLFKGRQASLAGGGRVELRETTAIRNDPSSISGFPGVEADLSKLLGLAGIDREASDVLNMTPRQWASLLKRARDNPRRSLLQYANFAHIVVMSPDGHSVPQTVLRGDDVAVDGRNRVQGYFCIHHILNVRDESGEPEAIIFTDGRCPPS